MVCSRGGVVSKEVGLAVAETLIRWFLERSMVTLMCGVLTGPKAGSTEWFSEDVLLRWGKSKYLMPGRKK